MCGDIQMLREGRSESVSQSVSVQCTKSPKYIVALVELIIEIIMIF